MEFLIMSMTGGSMTPYLNRGMDSATVNAPSLMENVLSFLPMQHIYELMNNVGHWQTLPNA